MDDFEYSVQISEEDWNSFFLECEECSLLPPVLAGMEDSGMSDMDEIASHRACMETESRVPEPELQTTEHDHVESPVDLYLSRYGMSSPMQVLSGSEDDLHMEAVNVFFERLKKVSASEDPLMQKHYSEVGREMAGHLKGSTEEEDVKKTALPGKTLPNRSRVTERIESMEKEGFHTFTHNSPIANEFREVKHAFLDKELVMKEEIPSWGTVKERMKYDDPRMAMRLRSGLGKIPCCTIVNDKNLIASNQNNKANFQLVTISDSDSKELVISQGQSSITPRRKRRKKKRTSIEPVEADHGHEVQFHAKESKSDEDIFVRRKEMDREICPSGGLPVAPPALPPPPKRDSILENLLVHSELLPGNGLQPTMVYPKSPISCLENLECPGIITAMQDKRTSDLMHEKSDLTGKPVSTKELSSTVNFTPTKTGVPVKKIGPLMVQSDDNTSTSTNTDNVESHLQLNSNLEDKAALQVSKALPASVTTCYEVESLLETSRKPENTENPLLLFSRDMKMDSKSSILHHTSDLQMNSETLPLTAFLQSNPAVCSQLPYSPHAQSQETFRQTVTFSDFQCERCAAVCQKKSPASANVSCLTFPEITQEDPPSVFHNNAENKKDLTCVPTVPRNTSDFLCKQSLSGTFDSKLETQSESLSIGKAQVSLQNVHYAQASECPSAYAKPEEQNEVSEEAVISNASVSGRLPLYQQNEDWTEAISTPLRSNDTISLPKNEKYINFKSLESENGIPTWHSQSEGWTEGTSSSLRSKGITNLPAYMKEQQEDIPSSAVEENESNSLKEQTKKCQQIADPEILPSEDSKLECISPTTNDEEKDKGCCLKMECTANTISESKEGTEYTPSTKIATNDKEEVQQALLNSSPSNYELTPSIITQDMAPAVLETVDVARGLEPESSQREVWTEEIYMSQTSNEINDLPSDVQVTNEVLSIKGQSKKCLSFIESTGLENQQKEDTSPHHSCTSSTEKKDIGDYILKEFPYPQSTDGADHIPNNTITTGNEDKRTVPYTPPKVPTQEPTYSSSTVMHRIASPTLQSMDGAEHTSCNHFISGVEENRAIHCTPVQFSPKDYKFSSSAVMRSIASPAPQSMEGSGNISSNIISNGVEENGKVQLISPQFPKDDELLPIKIKEEMASPSPKEGPKSLETVDSVNQPTPPVYAMSSFWNEMEKLTINDILRLRLVGQAQHPGVLLQPEDSGMVDTSDAADSGYFTHLDDSKPDRSSGDMSFISDFDEELAQLQTPEPAKLDEETQVSPNSEDQKNSEKLMWVSDLDPSGTATGTEDVFMLSSETALPPPLYRDNAQQCLRKMCKNISVQNLQAMESQPFRKILRNASLLSIHSVHSTHSIHTEGEDSYVDPFDRVEVSSPVYLSDEEEDTESAGITFSEVIQYLFGGKEPDRCASAADNVTPSYLDGTGTCVPETYDDFFSEFEDGSLFYPLAEDTSSSKEDLVPIFSCSRSTNKNFQFPEVYDYFFHDDSPSNSEEDEEHDQTVIQVLTRHDHMVSQSHHAVTELDTDENLCPETDHGWNFLRNNPLSFRRARRTGFTAPPEKSSSLDLIPVKSRSRTFLKGIQPINAMGADENPFSDPLILSLENRIFGQLANQQNIQTEMQTAVADPRVDAALMPLKQADMCLVCIAFASWVLKSVNPQGADMWKAALLANVSALSAIRYLRRYMRDEAVRKSPLRQTETA